MMMIMEKPFTRCTTDVVSLVLSTYNKPLCPTKINIISKRDFPQTWIT